VTVMNSDLDSTKEVHHAALRDPKVSVVICVRNMAQYLPTQLEAVLKQQTSFLFEVVVVDNGSSDGSGEIASNYAEKDSRVRVVEELRAGVNTARNRGVAAAAAPIVALCDADDRAEPGWLEALSRVLEPNAFVAGALRDGGLNTPDVRLLWSLEAQVAAVPHWVQDGHRIAPGNNCCFYKGMWKQIGGFDETLSGAGDETEFFVRAGRSDYELREAPDALVATRLRDTALKVFLHDFDFGKHQCSVVARWANSRWFWPRAAVRLFRIMSCLPRLLFERRGRYLWLSDVAILMGEVAYHSKTGLRSVFKGW
jgi:glycosyltransferase involved in cell wall biosynthesis